MAYCAFKNTFFLILTGKINGGKTQNQHLWKKEAGTVALYYIINVQYTY